MAEPPVKKQKTENSKSKAYQYTSKKRHYLEIGQKGFLATCNYREKDCVRECYNVLSQYADQLYGPEPKPESKKDEAPKKDNEEKGEETDIADDLQKEIDAAQAISEPGRCRRFQAVDTGTKNCVFIKTTLSDPVELGVKLIKDIAEKKLQKTRFLLRLTPIEKVCKADVDEISKAGDKIFDKYFLGDGKTFSVVYNKRYNNDIKRDVVIKVLADKILEMNPKNKVDLKNPELSVIVEIVKGKCCLSVVEGYLKYRKYNLVELAAVKAENGSADKEDDEKPEVLDDSKDEQEPTGAPEEAVKRKATTKAEDSSSEEEGAAKRKAIKEADDDASPESIIRDVPVGKKLKELLERKKPSDDEPVAKKFKDESEPKSEENSPSKESPEKPDDK